MTLLGTVMRGAATSEAQRLRSFHRWMRRFVHEPEQRKLVASLTMPGTPATEWWEYGGCRTLAESLQKYFGPGARLFTVHRRYPHAVAGEDTFEGRPGHVVVGYYSGDGSRIYFMDAYRLGTSAVAMARALSVGRYPQILQPATNLTALPVDSKAVDELVRRFVSSYGPWRES